MVLGRPVAASGVYGGAEARDPTLVRDRLFDSDSALGSAPARAALGSCAWAERRPCADCNNDKERLLCKHTKPTIWVLGTGAVGMAFVDTLLDETDATVLMVDNHALPGGHWNDAYPFVRLHQPSHFYGVASTALGSKHVDQAGSNAGFFELASGAEVLSYFERVMRQRFLPSGRVEYFPMCEYEDEYEGGGRFRSLLSGEAHEVTVRRRVVDCTFFRRLCRHDTSATTRWPMGSAVCPPRSARVAPQYSAFCVIGAGKTAMDALVWLLDQGAAPEQLRWVCPRRSWLINRDVTQGSVEYFKQSIGGFAGQMEAIAQASSLDDLFERLEAAGFMLRIHDDQAPTMVHYATMSHGELRQLKRIEH